MPENPRLRYTDDGQVRIRVGAHSDIESPFYAPELKNWYNDLHITLDQRQALEESNPVLVPGWDWQDLRERPTILRRQDEDGEECGKQEVEELERNHPLIHWFPPEMFAFSGQVDLLRKHLLKREGDAKKRFREGVVEGDFDAALDEVPSFTRPFFRTNLKKFDHKWGFDEQVEPDATFENSVEAWKALDEGDYTRFFEEFVDRAKKTPSWAVIPPAPLLRDYDSELLTSLCMANSKMAELAQEDGEPRGFFHLYLHYSAFDDSVDENTAEKVQGLIEKEIERSEYAGIALTVYNAEKAFDVSNEFRIGTFLENLSRVAHENHLPLFLPRSEWFGLFATDFGIDGFSSLYNGEWRYTPSGGGLDEADKYGQAVVKGESKAVKIQDGDGDDVEDYTANGSFPSKSELPSSPPNQPTEDLPDDPSPIQEQFGTDLFYRRHFGKPQRLNHIWEAQTIRKKRQNGESRPARKIIENEHEYVQFDDN